MKLIWQMVVAVACLVAVPAGMVSALVIDEFDSGPAFTLTVNSGSPTATRTDFGLAGVVGGTRQVDLFWVAGLSGNATVVHPPVTSTDHFLDLNDTVTLQSSMRLTYAGPAGTGFAPVDFTQGGATSSINLLYLYSDLGSTTQCTVTDALNNTGFQTQLSPSGASIQSFQYAGFSGGVDFTQITSIVYQIDSVANGDYRIDFIETGTPSTIPEPLTASALLMGVAGIGRYVRRRMRLRK